MRLERAWEKGGYWYHQYKFDTDKEMRQTGLIDDNRRWSCFMSSGKYYVVLRELICLQS